MFSWSPWLQAPAGLPSLCERVPPGVARFGAAAALRRGSLCRVPPGLARAQNSAPAGARGAPGAARWLLGAYRSLGDRPDARCSRPGAAEG